ncbi:cyclic nucleotide-binding domain-containing protein [Granulosicoccus antarcticus]|uniref:Acetyltransferase Pat n=1 Tax=Granulosicoccus antarcticus IMCC3135 TaxID=1192854 RepID=A0A2Z2NWZ5_9GAMM|nr:cyclic nucleotide-binding domain-containing protein [Granulosicoccus antarcticus]ASJ75952.1 Acetyltransferase Pat [Granulosicoccus antarcticus IMCC3135]
MNLDDELNVLRDIPLFSGVDPAPLKLLAFASDRMIFQPGQELFRQGDQASTAYVILSGSADIYHDIDEGQEKIGEAAVNTVIGEVSLLCDKPRKTTVIASSTIEALLITKDSFQKLMSGCPCTMSNILNGLGKQMSETS